MTNQWEQLLAVQALDTHISQLDHRNRQLPERAALADVEDRLATSRRETEAAEQARAELLRAQKKLEDEIADVQAKIDHDNEQLYAGSSDPSVLQSLQHEIETRKAKITALEDDELELMEQVEPIDARLEALASQHEALDAEAVDVTATLATKESEISTDLDASTAERGTLVADIDEGALQRYETVRDRLGGVAVARLEGGVCGACHMKLSAMEQDRIQHLPADAEVECEDCGRFLVRS